MRTRAALSGVAIVAIALAAGACGNGASTRVAPAPAGTGSSGGAGSGGLGGGGGSADGGAGDLGGGSECDLPATIAVATPSVAIAGPLRVDDDDVYFVGGAPAALYAAPKSGGDARLVANLDDDAARDFAVDATAIYLIDGSLTLVDKSSGAARTLEARDPTRLALSAGNVYWVAGDRTIGALPAGGAARTLATETSQTAARALAADEAHVSWADDSGVWRVATHGGAPEQLSRDVDGYALATDGHSLFVARATTVYAIAAPHVEAPIYDEARVTGLASDGHALYVAGDHGVARVGADGRARTLLSPDAAAGVAVDDRYVYFATRDGIFKACK